MSILEKLTYFETKGAEIKTKTEALNKEAQDLDKEFTQWIETTFGLTGQHHLSTILKNGIEQSYGKTN